MWIRGPQHLRCGVPHLIHNRPVSFHRIPTDARQSLFLFFENWTCSCRLHLPPVRSNTSGTNHFEVPPIGMFCHRSSVPRAFRWPSESISTTPCSGMSLCPGHASAISARRTARASDAHCIEGVFAVFNPRFVRMLPARVVWWARVKPIAHTHNVALREMIHVKRFGRALSRQSKCVATLAS